jgi:ABC-type oligopeptide transport system ATPase subunit
MEQAIKDYCSGATSDAAFLIGATGIGKSTLIRHSLQMNRSPLLSNGSLFIPFSLNQRHIEDGNEMRRKMALVFQQAVWLAKGEPHQFSQDDIEQIAAFIELTSPDLLNDPVLDLTKSPIARTQALSNRREAAYEFSQVALKYFAAKNKNIDRLVLIIDDLEGKLAEFQEAVIMNSLETRACLLNTSTERRVPVRLIIALRPETHIWASQLDQVKITEFREIFYTKPVSLFDIFKLRFDAVFNSKDYALIQDAANLEQALSVLQAVGNALSTKFSSRLVRLNNYNLRSSLETFRLIVSNRRWLQKDPDWRTPSFFEEKDFAINPAAVIRAIGMGERGIYPQGRTCIPNLLYNTREPISDLLLLYITKFLRLQNEGYASTKSLTDTFKRLLDNHFNQFVFDQLIDYGFLRGLVHKEMANGRERLSETIRSKELYGMLEESSLLLELFRDDICQPLDNGLPLRATMALGGGADRFVAVAALIKQLWNAEIQLRKLFALNGPESGSSDFGNIFECARMRAGFLGSLDAFYKTRDDRPIGVANVVESLRLLTIPEGLQ